MFRHSFILLPLLWASCSIVQPFPVKNQPHSEVDDISVDEKITTPEEMFKVSLKQALENDTSFEDLDMPEEIMNQTHNPLENENLFEGDLDIPEELIEEYYGNATRTKRAAVRRNSRLWPSGKVYYQFASYVSSTVKDVIRSAINDFQRHTCLRFHYRNFQSDYIEFTTQGAGCSSDFIGRKGGKQVIILGPGCTTKGIVLHEIGHAIGFWHEHTRPDRDNFVRIITSNINIGREHNFRKRTHNDVDSRGYSYDYGSIMHYRQKAFSRNGLPTVEVTNPTTYANLGYPSIGQGNDLSSGDIAQVNELYDCPSPHRLWIYARNGHNLPNQDDPYMEFVAYDLYGSSVRKTTSVDCDDGSPEWWQWLDFGTRMWKRFTLKVWDSDPGRDDALSSTHTFDISRGTHLDLEVNCTSGGWVRFDYQY